MTVQDLKDLGMSIAAQNHASDLEKARKIAHGIGLALGRCSINDIRRVWPGEFPSGNWTGSIFKDGCWTYIQHVPSYHSSGHGRHVAQWRFKGSQAGVKSAPSMGRVAVASGEAPATPVYKKQPDLFEGAA